jgi:hypothetical protein
LVLVENSDDGKRMRWSTGDDKMIADFIRTEDDFFHFATILAETHGLEIKPDWRRDYGPSYVFV